MGLLDQVLGQVIGGLAGGQGSARPEPGGTPAPPQGGGSANPLILAILALVASRVVHQGAGGLGSKLRDLLAGANSLGTGRPTGGGLETSGLPGGGGVLGGDRPQERSSGDGFLDSIGSMLDNPHPGRNPRETGGERRAPAGVPPSGPGGGMFGDGMGGGLAAAGFSGLVGSGLGGLLERFRQNGRGDVFESWVGTGPNEPISPDDLGGALGDDTIDALARETGLGRADLLAQLSQALPQVVDGLTPAGRLPDPDEESRRA
ncbi:YidB family protein [Enterovirga aerilata]|uniref:DUF937 domain-containing protein n=1 Tax=Enterovirga aerilata TaxID=2730920 RepID=A0A849IGA8_9HYPH|nr:YidB family protein [Enterovirga sp. DB1703]NNM74987.1 DUF937 domain-containing protein [Enterovirga sp. DB1703]